MNLAKIDFGDFSTTKIDDHQPPTMGKKLDLLGQIITADNINDNINTATIGQVMTDSKIVRKLTFTGSTGVGAKLYAQCAPTVKKLGLELGGNAPFIVFDDADLDAAVEGALISKFRNNGQTCVCANRIYVQAGVYDVFAEKLAAKVGELLSLIHI